MISLPMAIYNRHRVSGEIGEFRRSIRLIGTDRDTTFPMKYATHRRYLQERLGPLQDLRVVGD